MKIFTLDQTYSVVCNTADTRNGFKHVATLCRNGYEIAKAKICYLNRTWERFTYEDVLIKVVNDNFETGKGLEVYLKIIKDMI